MGQKTSVYLPDDLTAMWRASKLPLTELIRRGLNAGGPIDEATLEATLNRVLDEKLARLPVPECRAQTGYGGGYESERYLQDP
jgi:hypothetical protein